MEHPTALPFPRRKEERNKLFLSLCRCHLLYAVVPCQPAKSNAEIRAVNSAFILIKLI